MSIDMILVYANVALSLMGIIVNILAYVRYRELGRWIFMILAFNCLVVLITYAQMLIGQTPCVLQLRGEITLILASLIAAPFVLALGRRKCP